ncbi:hypothetical protein M431DRAFT_485355 [Trichoderma harzianum CBS 226.95]|uniref:Uncharacterized protein n=1 Tax=Trichoderma harzianum CBS 226.95 TaxID=983964 RepID=A0A2T4A0P0_TRIHA|nr:hypothetical protein M431DRAFT_485355 [Trichoderma harzianum CBS 226.95]PTB50632.1 hypothetical protein M431DRAFT_485355 [Trichoderma harzianum CBS 226.95]
MGKFARTAQTTHLLGRVLRHVSDTEMDPQFSREERRSLERALQSLLSLTIDEEKLSTSHYCSPIALSARHLSALLVLHSHPEADALGAESRARSLAAMEALSRVTLSFAHKFITEVKFESDEASPLLLDIMYRSAAVFITLQQTHVCDEFRDCEQVLTRAMEKLGVGWMATGVYLELLEARRLATVQLEIST